MKKYLSLVYLVLYTPNLILECLKNYQVTGIDIKDRDESFPINDKRYNFEKKMFLK